MSVKNISIASIFLVVIALAALASRPTITPQNGPSQQEADFGSAQTGVSAWFQDTDDD